MYRLNSEEFLWARKSYFLNGNFFDAENKLSEKAQKHLEDERNATAAISADMQAMFDDNQNVTHLVAVCHEGQIAAAVVEGLDHQRVVGAVLQGRQIVVTELET